MKKPKKAVKFFRGIISLIGWVKRESIYILQLAVYVVAITTFFIGLDFFSKKAKIEIMIPEHLVRVMVYQKDLYKFYVNHKFSIPDKLKGIIRNVLLEKKYTAENTFYSSHRAILRYMSMKKEIKEKIYGFAGNIDYLLSRWAIKDLEEKLNVLVPVKEHSGAFVSPTILDASELAKRYKKNLSTQEYYILLMGLLRSRTIEQTLIIANRGDLEVKDVSLIIPAPYSDITESRKGNIINIKGAAYQPLYYYEQGDDYVKIKIPKLTKGQVIYFNVYTRENRIDKEKIYVNYVPINIIDQRKALRCFILLFLVLVLLKYGEISKFFRSNNVDSLN